MRFGLGWLTTDVRLAMRRWRHRPGAPLTMVATLALGIAATTAIFSVVDAVLLRPLPWPDPDRLVVIHGVDPARVHRPSTASTWNRMGLTWKDWDALQGTGVFEHVAAWQPARFTHYRDDGSTEVLNAMYASANLLDTLGEPPALGRTFSRADDRATHVNEVLISSRLWQRQFGGREDILESVVALGSTAAEHGEPYRVVGVLPPGLRIRDEAPDIIVSIGRTSHNLSFDTAGRLKIVARMAPGVTLEVARSAATAQVRGTEVSPTRSARVERLSDDEVGHAARPLWTLLGGAGLLLLVSCANIAGLLLGEVRARRHEIAVRTSLGSGFGRVLRQLTVEQVLLCLVASAAGVLLAIWLLPALTALAPDRLPRLAEVRIDWRLAGVSLVLGTITALVFALVPTIALARTPAALVLQEGSREGAGGRHFGQRLVVSIEVALALVLIVGATLFGESLLRLQQRPLGFQPDGLIVVSLSEAGRAYSASEWQSVLNVRSGNAPQSMPPRGPDGRILTREDIDQLIRSRAASTARRDAITNALMTVPGVTAVAGVTQAPFVSPPVDSQVNVSGADDAILASRVLVTGDYFSTLGIPIVVGQHFEPNPPAGVRQIVLSRELSRRLFGESSPVGRQVEVVSGSDTRLAFDVVGVAADTRHQSLSEEQTLMFYTFNASGNAIGSNTVAQYLARTSVDPGPLLPSVRDALRNTNPPLAVTSVTTMEELVAGTVAEPRFRAMLAVIFGGAALFLSAVGLYALTSRRVEERTREIGVRVALGAQPHDVRRLVLVDVAKTVGAGFAVGVPAAFALSQLTQALLFGVSATSPRNFAMACGILIVAAGLAVVVPVRRAAKVDPTALIRSL
jgi:putative ABC transport system permease protein